MLKAVPANGMVAGNPARVVGRTKDRRPALGDANKNRNQRRLERVLRDLCKSRGRKR